MQLWQDELLIVTLRTLAVVSLHELLLSRAELRLHAFAPMYRTLNDPPKAFAEEERPVMIVELSQMEQRTSLMLTLRSLAVVVLHALLLSPFKLKFQV